MTQYICSNDNTDTELMELDNDSHMQTTKLHLPLPDEVWGIIISLFKYTRGGLTTIRTVNKFWCREATRYVRVGIYKKLFPMHEIPDSLIESRHLTLHHIELSSDRIFNVATRMKNVTKLELHRILINLFAPCRKTFLNEGRSVIYKGLLEFTNATEITMYKTDFMITPTPKEDKILIVVFKSTLDRLSITWTDVPHYLCAFYCPGMTRQIIYMPGNVDININLTAKFPVVDKVNPIMNILMCDGAKVLGLEHLSISINCNVDECIPNTEDKFTRIISLPLPPAGLLQRPGYGHHNLTEFNNLQRCITLRLRKAVQFAQEIGTLKSFAIRTPIMTFNMKEGLNGRKFDNLLRLDITYYKEGILDNLCNEHLSEICPKLIYFKLHYANLCICPTAAILSKCHQDIKYFIATSFSHSTSQKCLNAISMGPYLGLDAIITMTRQAQKKYMCDNTFGARDTILRDIQRVILIKLIHYPNILYINIRNILFYINERWKINCNSTLIDITDLINNINLEHYLHVDLNVILSAESELMIFLHSTFQKVDMCQATYPPDNLLKTAEVYNP